MASIDGREVRISIFPQLGGRTHKGTVGILVDDHQPVFIGTVEAREMGVKLIAAGYVAEGEEVLVRWLVEKLGYDDQAKIKAVIDDFRAMRIEGQMPGGGPPQ